MDFFIQNKQEESIKIKSFRNFENKYIQFQLP
jgi:hypothetical protein